MVREQRMELEEYYAPRSLSSYRHQMFSISRLRYPYSGESLAYNCRERTNVPYIFGTEVRIAMMLTKHTSESYVSGPAFERKKNQYNLSVWRIIRR